MFSDYNILQDVINVTPLETIDYSDGIDKLPVYKFTEKSNSTALIRETTLSDKTLSAPFIMNVMFQFDLPEDSCLFAIIDSRNLVKLRLCLKPISETSLAVLLETSSSVIDDDRLKIDINNITNWIDMFLVLKRDTVEIYLDCKEQNYATLDKEIEDIFFSSDSAVFIAQSDIEKKVPFNVSSFGFH